jgi:RND family efflux transporter MFP subunit
MRTDPSDLEDIPRAHVSRRGWRWLGVSTATVLVASLLWWRPWRGRASLETDDGKLPSVGVIRVTREDMFKEKTIPAEFRAYYEVELNAKVSGYVQTINVDFGDKVKSGQLLATIEVPELMDQLHNAIATEQAAEADYTNAHLIYTRLGRVNKDHPNLVAQQDLDTAAAKDLSSAAAIAAAKAEVERYVTLSNYTRITAPFDGVITWRSADPGSLIQAGTSSQAIPLLRISDNYLLRLDVPVDVEDVKDVHEGDSVEVAVDSLGGKTFTGKISRFTRHVNLQTRTMITELEVENPNLEIVPGMYARVTLKFERHQNALAVPIQAVEGQKNLTVYVVNANHEIEERPVKLGLEMPNQYEVIEGLEEGECVMIGNRSTVHPGQKVESTVVPQLSFD